jgi:hypothetical protein
MTGHGEARGRADMHIHTLASDGTAGVEEILDHVERRTDLDVIAISDHERIDAALAARSIARDRGLRAEVVIGEEVTTLGGHLLALYLDRPIRPYRSLRTTILDVHDAGGIAIPAHPLVPFPLCAQGWIIRRLLDDPDPSAYRPCGVRREYPLRRPARSRACRQQRCAFARGDRVGLDDLPGTGRCGPSTGDRAARDRPRRDLPRDDRATRDLRSAIAQARA